MERVAGRVLTLEAGAGRQAGRVTLRAEPGSFVTIILHAAADGAVAGSPVPTRPA